MHGHFEAVFVGCQGERFHFADGRLAVIDDLVEVDDGPVDVLAVDRCRKGFVQGVQVVHFHPVGLVFVLADQLANRRVAAFHEFNQ